MAAETQGHLAFVLQHTSTVGAGSLVDAAHSLGLSASDAERITALHMLVSNLTASFAAGLPSALRALPRTSAFASVDSAAVVAAIDWSATMRLRSQNGWNPTTYVTRPPLRLFDVPETQVLRFVVNSLANLLRIGTALMPPAGHPADWVARVARAADAVDLGRRNWVLMACSPIEGRADRAIAAAAGSRNLFVRDTVVPLARLYRSLFAGSASAEDVRRFLSETVFVCVEDWHLFELTLLFRLVRSFASSASAFRVGLLSHDRPDVLASFDLDEGTRLDLRYQRRPDARRFTEPLYGLLRHYGLPPAMAGTPDIVIERMGGRRRRVLVEVKYSSDVAYLADGFRQLDGYLRAVAPDRVESSGLVVGDADAFDGPPYVARLTATREAQFLTRCRGLLELPA